MEFGLPSNPICLKLERRTQIVPGFDLWESVFDRRDYRFIVEQIFSVGKHRQRGFEWPVLKANRFHQKPRYPVKNYMCLGYYWSPADYHYYVEHPRKGAAIPQWLLQIVSSLSEWESNSCIVNFYSEREGKSSSMGLHRDLDEGNIEAPIVALSFGSTARFQYEWEGKLYNLRLPGNSIYRLSGEMRSCRHGVPYIYSNSLDPLGRDLFGPKERLGLTFRYVDPRVLVGG